MAQHSGGIRRPRKSCLISLLLLLLRLLLSRLRLRFFFPRSFAHFSPTLRFFFFTHPTVSSSFSSTIRIRISLSFTHESIRALTHLFSPPFQRVFFLSRFFYFYLFVRANGFTYLQAFFSWSCIHLPFSRQTYLPPVVSLSFSFSFLRFLVSHPVAFL